GIQTSKDEKIAWLVVTKEMRERYKATIEDTESFVTQLTLLEKVHIGILFREEDDGVVKVSIRGNRSTPVWQIAKQFAGGGHRHAAGMRLKKPLTEAVQLVFEAAERALNSTSDPAAFP